MQHLSILSSSTLEVLYYVIKPILRHAFIWVGDNKGPVAAVVFVLVALNILWRLNIKPNWLNTKEANVKDSEDSTLLEKRLKEIDNLRNRGIITDYEYRDARANLLRGLNKDEK